MSDKTNDRRVRKTQKAIFDALAELLTKKELEKITLSFAGSTWQMSADRPFRALCLRLQALS